MKLNNCTHFYCQSCQKIKSLDQAHKVSVAWPIFERGHEEKLVYNKGIYLLCDLCFNPVVEEKKNETPSNV